MGNQVCCQQRSIQTEMPSVMPLSTPSGRIDLRPSATYSLSPQAQITYDKLKIQYGDDDFLNVTSQMKLNPHLQYRASFSKLPTLNAFYSGQWKDSIPQGRGRVIFPNGSLLIGVFKHNACNDNQCHFIFKDGSHYQGGMVNNALSGRGKLVNQQIQYQGYWADGKPHGGGTEIFKNGDKFIGNFQNGKKHGSDCTFSWHNHQQYLQYVGQFIDNKICGKGKLTLKNGTIIVGIFDEQSILSATCSNPKLKCSCSFIKGQIQGNGKVDLNHHDQYEGQFKDGQLYGKCIHIDSKSRKNEVFIFKGRQIKQVRGLQDHQIDHILEVIQKVYRTMDAHSDAIKKINHDFNKEYEAKLIQPFETIFEYLHYLIIQIFGQTILVKTSQQN